MALFNRNKKTQAPDMPPELKEYYVAEGRDRTWMAWLLGLATLVVTLLLAAALFFGGRWAYRKITNDQPSNGTTSQVEQNQDEQRERSGGDDAEVPPTEDSDENTNEEATTPGSTDTDTSDRTPVSPTDDLPDTGPADTLAIFVAVSVLAYVAHRRYSVHNA